MASGDNSGLAVGALRSFTVAEGILLLVLGVLSLIFPMIASAWVTVVVALAFLVGGIIGWVNSFSGIDLLVFSAGFHGPDDL